MFPVGIKEMAMPEASGILPEPSPIGGRIYTVRGQAVMLDSDLAEAYGVLTKALNQAVDRNEQRFPSAFAFRLTRDEWDNLKSQSVTSSSRWGGRRKLPRVFTEHGAVMLASVLNSSRAVVASIQVVEAFVRLRHVLTANQALARKVDELAEQVGDHRKAIAIIFQELESLTQSGEPGAPKERIGFKPNKERGISDKRK